MTYKELSDAMDVMSNRYAQAKNISVVPFDEYEKSLFITKAANEIVKELLPFYDRNEKIKKQLLPITRTAQISSLATVNDSLRTRVGSVIYELPSDALYVVAESLRDSSNVIERQIRPIKDDELYYTLENPFRSSDRGYAYRNSISIVDSGVTKKYSEIISDLVAADSPKYFLKYLTKVPVFIVTDSLEDASVEGVSENLNLTIQAPLDMLHEKILDRAIVIGYFAKTDDPNSKIASSNLSINS